MLLLIYFSLELRRLRGTHSLLVEDELQSMENEVTTQNEKRSLWSVLRDPTLLLPIVLVCALQGGQQLSGINAVRINKNLHNIKIINHILICYMS